MNDARGVSPLLLAAVLSLVGAVAVVLGSAVGSTGWQAWGDVWTDPIAWQIVSDIRLPRSAGAWAGGALLGLSGAIAQGLFRNPLADPYLLGSASGASLGVSLALWVMGGGVISALWPVRFGLTAAAFAGAMLAVLLTLALARGVQHTVRLLLAGVIVGVVLGAITSLISLWQPEVMQAMQAFLLGSTAFVGWSACGLMWCVLLLCLLISVLCARVLDALSLGQTTAQSLGLPLGPLRALLVAVLALATGTAVAQMGLIAFVGLAAPHAVRALTRCTHRWSLPLSAGMGGGLLVLADVLARGAMAPEELPVGVLTAVLGGSYLLGLMHRQSIRGGA
jgi:iron complex transport system permease protein